MTKYSSSAKYDSKIDAFRFRPFSPSFLQPTFKIARKATKISKPVTPDSLRYSFATEAAAVGNNIAEIQITLGHKDPNTTARYIEAEQTIRGVGSPLDTLYQPLT